MKPVADETLLGQLQWRYATKKFDPSRKIDPQTWQTLESAVVQAPSSYGLQPWKFFVVTNPEIRTRLKAVSWNQAQITDASHLVVFAVRTEFTPADVERFLARTVEVRGVTSESLEGYRQMMLGSLKRPSEELFIWNARQVYIALGFFLSAAALIGVDACPMEGFDPKQYDEILGLTAQGYRSVVLATAGYRSAEDRHAADPKVRFKVEDVVAHI